MYVCTQLDRMMRRLASSVAVLLFMAALFSSATPNLYAQASATISGTVTDPKGALIVGATVTVLNETTQDGRQGKTNKDGLYAFPDLLPSSYTVKVVSSGFSPKELTGVDLHAGDQIQLPVFAL